jgi:Reverse transcriptase (RNA-dependent DNA polymerase)
VADVSPFYESVYTHTIPWAINGKDAAKADSDWKSNTVFGNRLDFPIRQAQSRQTQGIPVGPDSSDIAGEIVLSAVDEEFIQWSKPSDVVYRRHVDDYWVGGHTIEECERHLALLRLTLRQYQLDINEAKTKIVLTRTVLGGTWPKDFEREIVKTLGHGTSDSDVLAVLAKVVDFAATNNDDGIIRHIIHVIDRKELWASNWSLLQHFIAQCSVQFPHSFDYAARVVAWRWGASATFARACQATRASSQCQTMLAPIRRLSLPMWTHGSLRPALTALLAATPTSAPSLFRGRPPLCRNRSARVGGLDRTTSCGRRHRTLRGKALCSPALHGRLSGGHAMLSNDRRLRLSSTSVVSDTAALQHFIVGRLSKTRGVANIRSSFAPKQVKYKAALSINHLIDRKWPAPPLRRGCVVRDEPLALEVRP